MKKSFIILLNIAYWIMYLLLLGLFLLIISSKAAKGIVSTQDIVLGFVKVMTTITIIPGLISFYTFYHFIFNRFLSRRKIGKAIIYGLAVAFVSGIIGFIGFNIISNERMFSHGNIKEMLVIVCFLSVLCLVHGVIAVIIKGFISWYGDIRIKAALQQKNFETELALVKLQLNPHFLFNTINNIDVLIEKDAAKASLYLNKLSDIMRFMLYETKTEWVPLEKEMAYISKYIDLQKIRNANPGYVQYHTSGNAGGLLIASMLFIPFIENAFKHAANKRKENAISISISIEEKKILFYCSNYSEANPLDTVEAGGLGNDLIRKRLNLLYPGRHELQISKENGFYTVQLSVDTVNENQQSFV